MIGIIDGCRASFLVDFCKRRMSDGRIGGDLGGNLGSRFFSHRSCRLSLRDFFCPRLLSGVWSIS